ncbi:MAG: hypothetical protein K0S76_500 [Herbinix sp.]|nr:hypothetical protein [Herbinix sp.]
MEYLASQFSVHNISIRPTKPTSRQFGYRIMQEYMFTTSDDAKKESVNRLKKIYEMRDM